MFVVRVRAVGELEKLFNLPQEQQKLQALSQTLRSLK